MILPACANKSDMDPMIAALEQKENKDAVQPVRGVPGLPEGAIITNVTLKKSAILGREFLYGATLQTSSIVEEDLATAMMGISLTQLPASFKIVDDKLRLESDDSINFESDVNHPSRLIFEFPIISQDADTMVIQARQPSPVVHSFLFTKDSPDIQWAYIRSMEFAAADELFLIESTVELKDKSRASFMESLRPRAKVIPADAKAIYADAELNAAATRYRFLDAGEVFIQKAPGLRIKTKAAARFVQTNGEAIKWYVTENIPDDYINDVKNAVLAWNRYSRAAGKPDLVSFEGKLPKGIKLGDPRYNTIVWDTVQEAGAAYESQNADPVTGIQTHSMIYIPLAWINIGKDYWNKMTPGSQEPGETPEEKRADKLAKARAERTAKMQKFLSSRKIAGRSLPVHCLEHAEELVVTASSQQKPEEFARELLKGVVMHEMGHALGLAHNFKGSLTYDADDATKAFSTSIMDYNHYNEEDGAFDSLDSANGPLLEYDRQIISVLYNEGKDVLETHAEVPACDDSEADSTDKGIDPLCNRYDIGSDPTVQAQRALKLFTEPGQKRGKMESITAQKVVDALIPMPPAAGVASLEQLVPAISKGISGMSGTVGIYIGASANSFGYLATQAVKSLKVFQADSLPEGYNAAEMRERALQVFEAGTTMNEFPAVTKEAVAGGRAKLLEYVTSSAFVAGLTREGQEKVVAALTKVIDRALVNVEVALTSRLRTRLITALASTPTAPLAFHERNGAKVDVEQNVMLALEQLSSQKAGSLNRPTAERAEALKSLKSYSRVRSFKQIAERVKATLELEEQASENELKREEVRKLLADFVKSEAGPAAKK